MGTATLERTSRNAAFKSAAELREVLERLFSTVEDDDRVGPLLRAAHFRVRLDFTDFRTHLNLASADGDEDYLRWSFAPRAPWEPKVTLRMDSSVANAWLQGEQSLAIAIARGRVRCAGETRSTLYFVPIAKLLSEPYRRVLDTDFEHLRIG